MNPICIEKIQEKYAWCLRLGNKNDHERRNSLYFVLRSHPDMVGDELDLQKKISGTAGMTAV
jgi:hypothetical protein